MRSLWPKGGLWRHGDFLKLWSAESISQLGSQISGLALPLVAVIVLEASTFQVAAIGVVEFLPFILFAIPAGVSVDRLRRKPILVIADLGRAGLLLSIPIAYARVRAARGDVADAPAGDPDRGRRAAAAGSARPRAGRDRCLSCRRWRRGAAS
ncbi:MAG: MFS transporter [Gaiellaceae bacterium]